VTKLKEPNTNQGHDKDQTFSKKNVMFIPKAKKPFI